jgi:hypothetical protein
MADKAKEKRYWNPDPYPEASQEPGFTKLAA